MSDKYKIKTVKEYLTEGPPQFDIILRREIGKTVNISIISRAEYKEEGIRDTIVDTTVLPTEDGKGIIQIVKRISDDVIFHQSDIVGAEGIGSCFIIDFKEDLINVSVGSLFEQQPILIEINNLTFHETISVDEELGNEQTG